MNKEELVKHFDTKTSWNSKELKCLVSAMKKEAISVSHFKEGDVIRRSVMGHPQLIYKINDRGIFSFMLTSDESMGVTYFESRFSDRKSYVTPCILKLEADELTLNQYWYSISKKELKRVKSQVVEYVKSELL